MAKPRDIGEEIIALRTEGLTYAQICSELNCSKGTVAYWLGEGQMQKYKESSKRARLKRYEKYYDLKSGPCTDCDKSFPPFLMHWDHLGEELKEDTVSRLLVYAGWQRVLDEINKCELVCSNCHGLRTISRSIESGTATDLLTSLYNEYMKGLQNDET